MNLPCGCCEGTGVLTPLPTANRPGLNILSYRVGAHAAFLETMKARLSSSDYPELASLRTRESADFSIALLDAWATLADVLTFYQERIANEGYLRTATERRSILELARLVGYKLRPGVASSVCLAYTVEKGSAAIPAGERAQSVPMPGEKLQSFETSELIKAGSEWNAIRPRMTRPTKIPLEAQAGEVDADTIEKIYIQGTATQLKPNDPLLFVFGEGPGLQVLRRVKEVTPQKAEGRTMVTLQKNQGTETYIKIIRRVIDRYLDIASFGLKNSDCTNAVIKYMDTLKAELCGGDNVTEELTSLTNKLASIKEDNCSEAEKQWIDGLTAQLNAIAAKLRPVRRIKPPSLEPSLKESKVVTRPDILRLTSLINPLLMQPLQQPSNSLRLNRDSKLIFKAESDSVPQMLTGLKSNISRDIYIAWANYEVKKPAKVTIYALRLTASLFGANAPPVMQLEAVPNIETKTFKITTDGDPAIDEDTNTIYLDNSYERILPDSWIVADTKNIGMTSLNSQVSRARNPQAKGSRSAYGISGSTTIIGLDFKWFDKEKENNNYAFKSIRTTVVYAQSEELKLAEESITNPISHKDIELDSLYPGLESGRWIIVSGERNDISGVKKSELVMLARVEQRSDEDQSGDKGTSGVHSTLILDKGLAYTYKRETVTIYANVVKATHGEIKKEVLGSGDGSAAFQQFALSQAPLTYLSAATPQGAKSSLQVRVNGIIWHEAESLFDLGPRDRGYITKTDDAGKTTVIFGNGEHGSRLPTGMENVTAFYRAGIGRPGNVLAGQIRLLATKPPGAKAVVNPLRSSGGADREGPDQGRRNAPLAAMALDRLVSVEDYAFFARTYAGIAKASAVSLSNGHRQLVHLTIAGSDDIPIDTASDLLRNLNQALHQFGDPFQPVQIAVRELMLLVISANVRILPDYQWEKVEPQIRSALLDAFGFDRRELGQSAFLSEAVSVIQQVEGVDYVDMVVFDSVSENVNPEDLGDLSSRLSPKHAIKVQLAELNKKSEKTDQDKRIQPAQLAYLSPDMRETLILNPLELSL